MLTDLPPLPQCDILDPGRFGVAWQEESVRAYGQACQAATLATVTPLVQLALEELDDGYEHAQDCMRICGSQYKCKCQKPATLAKLRAFLSGATKESNHGDV